MKAGFLAILTALPRCEAAREALDLPEVDQFLAQTARDSGVKVVGLETAQEQLEALETMRSEVAATLLTLAAREPSMNDDLYATLLRLYRESRPAEILPISDAIGGLSEAERAAQDQFMRVLLVDRNAVMAERRAFARTPAVHSSPVKRAASCRQDRSHRALPRRWIFGDEGMVKPLIRRKGSRCS